MVSSCRRRIFFTWCSTQLTWTVWKLIITSTRLLLNLVVYRPFGGLTLILYGFSVLCGLSGIWSIPFFRCSYLYIPLAGAVNFVTSPLDVALYQYAASWMEHCVFAIILLTVQWNRSVIPLPSGAYAPLYLTRTPHSAMKFRKSRPEKVRVLSVNILTGGPRSQKTALICRITDNAFCRASGRHSETHWTTIR